MVTAVILAAGASTRMGTQKLLLQFGNEPLIRRVARQICEVGFDDVLVVVGHEYTAVVEALKGLPLRHAVNADYARGARDVLSGLERGPLLWTALGFSIVALLWLTTVILMSPPSPPTPPIS